MKLSDNSTVLKRMITDYEAIISADNTQLICVACAVNFTKCFSR